MLQSRVVCIVAQRAAAADFGAELVAVDDAVGAMGDASEGGARALRRPLRGGRIAPRRFSGGADRSVQGRRRSSSAAAFLRQMESHHWALPQAPASEVALQAQTQSSRSHAGRRHLPREGIKPVDKYRN